MPGDHRQFIIALLPSEPFSKDQGHAQRLAELVGVLLCLAAGHLACGADRVGKVAGVFGKGFELAGGWIVVVHGGRRGKW